MIITQLSLGPGVPSGNHLETHPLLAKSFKDFPSNEMGLSQSVWLKYLSVLFKQ